MKRRRRPRKDRRNTVAGVEEVERAARKDRAVTRSALNFTWKTSITLTPLLQVAQRGPQVGES